MKGTQIRNFNHNRKGGSLEGRATEGWPEGRAERERASQSTRSRSTGVESGIGAHAGARRGMKRKFGKTARE